MGMEGRTATHCSKYVLPVGAAHEYLCLTSHVPSVHIQARHRYWSVHCYVCEVRCLDL